MFPYFYVSDEPLYLFSIILLLVGVLVSAFAQIKVKSNFSKYSKSYAPINGEQAAKRLLEANGIYNVQIKRCAGQLTDHFDPRDNSIYLSEGVYDTYSIAAVGIACHEAGHAVQHAIGYKPIKLRTAIIPMTQIGSSLAMPLVLLGILFSFYELALLGVVFFGAALLFQIVTLPVEFNASARARKTIREDALLSSNADISGVSKILTSAALTYVAAMLVSLAQFLRLLSIVNSRRR